MVTVLNTNAIDSYHISVGARYFLSNKIVYLCDIYSLPYAYFHMLAFITFCVSSRAGHVEVVRAIYPYVAQHVSWCQPRRPDSVAWAELLQYHVVMHRYGI